MRCFTMHDHVTPDSHLLLGGEPTRRGGGVREVVSTAHQNPVCCNLHKACLSGGRLPQRLHVTSKRTCTLLHASSRSLRHWVQMTNGDATQVHESTVRVAASLTAANADLSASSSAWRLVMTLRPTKRSLWCRYALHWRQWLGCAVQNTAGTLLMSSVPAVVFLSENGVMQFIELPRKAHGRSHTAGWQRHCSSGER